MKKKKICGDNGMTNRRWEKRKEEEDGRRGGNRDNENVMQTGSEGGYMMSVHLNFKTHPSWSRRAVEIGDSAQSSRYSYSE